MYIIKFTSSVKPHGTSQIPIKVSRGSKCGVFKLCNHYICSNHLIPSRGHNASLLSLSLLHFILLPSRITACCEVAIQPTVWGAGLILSWLLPSSIGCCPMSTNRRKFACCCLRWWRLSPWWCRFCSMALWWCSCCRMALGWCGRWCGRWRWSRRYRSGIRTSSIVLQN